VTPELSAEVHIIPKEVLEAGFEQHADYQKARDADLAGDAKEEKKATAVARKINDEAMAKFEKRNADEAKIEPEAKDGNVRDDKLSGRGGATDKADAGSPSSRFRVREVSQGSRGVTVRSDTASTPAPKLAKGVTVLVGDSHGIVRGGNPNFGSGGRWSVETPDGTKTLKGSDLTPVQSAKEKDQPHVAVDLDKTLAEMKGSFKPGVIGKPIPEMVDRVKKMVADGEDVRIFTARVADDPKGTERAAIEAWLHRNIGQTLPITDRKTAQTKLILDDRARQVEPNTGKVLA